MSSIRYLQMLFVERQAGEAKQLPLSIQDSSIHFNRPSKEIRKNPTIRVINTAYVNKFIYSTIRQITHCATDSRSIVLSS